MAEMKAKGIGCPADYQAIQVSSATDIIKRIKDNSGQVYFKGTLADNGATIVINSKERPGYVYYSYTYLFPSRAMSDGYMGDGQTYIPAERDNIIYFSFKELPLHDLNELRIEMGDQRGTLITSAPPTTSTPPKTSTAPPSPLTSGPSDSLPEMKKNAIKFANKIVKSLTDNNLIADQLCTDLWQLYTKEHFECIVGKDLAISNRKDFLNRYEFRFELSAKQFAVIVYVPDK